MAQVINNMPDEEYHALNRLSYSGIKKLLCSSQTFWKWSWFNERKKEHSSDEMNLGTAYHRRILCGKADFDQSYAVKPECDRRTKEGKEIYANFRAQYPDAVEIGADEKAEIEAAAHRIETNPALAGFFNKGVSEVVILWDDPETNVPMKAKIDHLTDDMIVDLKTFSNGGDSEIMRLLTTHIIRYKYYLQAATYTEAVAQAGLGDREFVLFFQQTGGYNNSAPVKLSKELLLFQRGQDEYRRGVRRFAEMYRKYGKSEWFDVNDPIALSDEDFPLYVYD
jgi:exodeoxyribonuclease VIII